MNYFKLFIFFLGISSAFARNPNELVVNQEHDLAQFDFNKGKMVVHYPGKISGICSINMRVSHNSSTNLKTILENIELVGFFVDYRNVLDAINPFDTEVDLLLGEGTYLDRIEMKVLTSETFTELLNRLNSHLLVSPVGCKDIDTP